MQLWHLYYVISFVSYLLCNFSLDASEGVYTSEDTDLLGCGVEGSGEGEGEEDGQLMIGDRTTDMLRNEARSEMEMFERYRHSVKDSVKVNKARNYCSDFRYESNRIFVLGVVFFSSDKFRLFN